MTDLGPSLQVLDTDGNGARKRRRPALSCVECRQRKIKCDRNKPCNHCTKSKSLTCTYRTDPVTPAKRGPDTTEAVVPATLSASNTDTSAQSSRLSENFDYLVDRYIAPGILPLSTRDTDARHGAHIYSPYDSFETVHFGSDHQSSIQALLEKVQDLEQKLQAASGREEGGGIVLAPSPITGEPAPSSGIFVKSRYFGQSHWMNSIEPFGALGKLDPRDSRIQNPHEQAKQSELYSFVRECKRMARVLKAERIVYPSISSEIRDSIPSKELVDRVVILYFSTFESIFRILHAPTFYRELAQYWLNPAAAGTSFIVKLLLVLVIGTVFYQQREDYTALDSSRLKWIQAAESWLSAPGEKSRLNLTGVQVHCLVLVARQLTHVDGDLVWISAGSLLRSAMHIGLHRDPSHFPKLSPFTGEMRRRLWSTVLELTVQSSLDMGMPPMLSLEDFDCRPPSNIDDISLDENDKGMPPAQSDENFTQASIQIALRASLPIRLRATRFINNFRTELSYEQTLKLGTEIAAVCRSNHMLFQRWSSNPAATKPTTFHYKMFDSFTRRFLLSIHRPYFMRAKHNPIFFYSRKVCLESSLALLSHIQPVLSSTELGDQQEDDYIRLAIHSTGFFKSIFLYANATIYMELVTQIEEEASASRPGQADQIRQALQNSLTLTVRRLEAGETNPKGHMFFACALARVDALMNGTSSDQAVLRAARESIETCSDLLKRQASAENQANFEGQSSLQTPESSEDVGGANPGLNWDTLFQDDIMDFGIPESWFFDGWQDPTPPLT